MLKVLITDDEKNSQETIKFLETALPEVLFLDIEMPMTSGF